MAADLVAASERYRRNNPAPAPADDNPRIEDHFVIVHIGHPPPA